MVQDVFSYQLVIPSSLKTKVLHDIHEGVVGGHLGVDKSLGKLKERFYWPGHYNDVKQWCATYMQAVLPGSLESQLEEAHYTLLL